MDGVSFFAGWSFGAVVAFGAAVGKAVGLSGWLPEAPVLVSRIPELVMPPDLLVIPPLLLMVALLPPILGLTVCWLWFVCCAMALALNTASRPARVSIFIASSTSTTLTGVESQSF